MDDEDAGVFASQAWANGACRVIYDPSFHRMVRGLVPMRDRSLYEFSARSVRCSAGRIAQPAWGWRSMTHYATPETHTEIESCTDRRVRRIWESLMPKRLGCQYVDRMFSDGAWACARENGHSGSHQLRWLPLFDCARALEDEFAEQCFDIEPADFPRLATLGQAMDYIDERIKNRD